MEHPSNIGLVCATHAPKPDPRLAKKPKGSFVGKYVKKAFIAGNPADGTPRIEHMWVKITSYDENGLVGKLDNDPVLLTELRSGDSVKVKMEEIEDVA